MEAMGSGVLICAWVGGVVFIAVRKREFRIGIRIKSERVRG
jgi:hypothetical protein